MRTFLSIIAGLFAALIGSTAWAAACDEFTDVDNSNSTYCSAVTYLKDKGITLGCTGTTYCPNDYVTRLQMALFLQRMGSGGSTNTLGHWTNSIGGGQFNVSGASGNNVIGGGVGNSADGGASVVAGGQDNVASGLFSAVSGGLDNNATGQYAGVTHGSENVASGIVSMAGGQSNLAAGQLSVVLGYKGESLAAAFGSFVFSDATDRADHENFGAGSPNIFVVGASGGTYLFTNKDYTTGCSIGAHGGTWACTSSKEVKRDFEDVDRQQVLDRVLALPVQTWRYKDEAAEIRHMGTFAQDFRVAFGLGSDDKTISMADADGVALAAIQGLNAKLEASQALIAEQAHELALLSAQLASVASQLEHVEARLH